MSGDGGACDDECYELLHLTYVLKNISNFAQRVGWQRVDWLYEFYDCDASASEADVFVVEVSHGGHGVEVLTDDGLQGTCTRTVQDFHT
jgi:hypothetical protein